MGVFGDRVACAVTLLGVLAGWGFSIWGLASTFSPYAAADDFKSLATPCVITGVYYDGTTRTTKHNHMTKKAEYQCFDVYTYEFAWCQDGTTCKPAVVPSSLGNLAPRPGYTIAGAFSSTATEVEIYRDWWSSFPPPSTTSNAGWDATLLLSAADLVARGTACDGSAQRNSTLGAGTWVTCYQPTNTPVDADFYAAYACGNAACVKVSDPALELIPPSMALLYFGLAVSVFFMLLLFCFVRKHGDGEGLLGLLRFIWTGEGDESK